eukprot:gene5756-518_t
MLNDEDFGIDTVVETTATLHPTGPTPPKGSTPPSTKSQVGLLSTMLHYEDATTRSGRIMPPVLIPKEDADASLSKGEDGSIQVFVRMEETYTIQVRTSDTGQYVKSRIAEKVQLGKKEFYVMYAGKILDGTMALKEYGVDAGSTLTVVVKGCGGYRKSSVEMARAMAATCKCRHKQSWTTCYHRAFIDGTKPLPYEQEPKAAGKYRIITWNATLCDLMSSWKEVEKGDWDCLMLQETQQ